MAPRKQLRLPVARPKPAVHNGGIRAVAMATPEKVAKYILQPERNVLCINDVRLSEEKYETLRKVIHESFEELFPQKSKFEK